MISREVPKGFRKLPHGFVAVRVTETAADAFGLLSGWDIWTYKEARRYIRLCREASQPKPRGSRWTSVYSGAQKYAMRRLSEQLEARLAK